MRALITFVENLRISLILYFRNVLCFCENNANATHNRIITERRNKTTVIS